ncbi:MAG TPA: ABC transporter permease [Candidatus Acidoferrum sp.]|nr:ABC transporter permease [Candidatus Acidoferrum sp.]
MKPMKPMNNGRHENWERELREELCHHFEKQVEALIAEGMAPEEARRQAKLQFGAVEGVKQDCREQRRGFWLDALLADLRYALRMLRKSPAFAAIAILTLALGIGANTAIFSVLNGVILKPLPYAQPDRLALIWTDLKSAGQTRAPSSGPDMIDLQRRSRLFEGVEGIWVGSSAITSVGEPEQVKLGFVTGDFLSLLGVAPARGRLFNAQDNFKGAAPTIILSDGLWRRRFGADPQIVGKTVKADGEVFTIIGVMPENFRLIFAEDANIPPDVQAFMTFRDDLARQERDSNYLRVVGRLKPGVTIAQADAEAQSIAAQLRAEYLVDSKQDESFEVLPLQEDTVRAIRPAVLALFVGVGLVLLISCANVANLLLARSGTRQREIALRAAMGATRGRIIRQLLTESVLLSLLGGAAGLILGWWGMNWLLALRPKSLGVMESVQFDFAVLGYAFAVSLIAGIVFGLAPAAEYSGGDMIETLKSGGKGVVAGKSRFRTLLVASEVALSFVLLIGSGLMIRTFVRLLNVDSGFNGDRVLTFQLSLPPARYPTDPDRTRVLYQMQKNLAALPGVESVGAVHRLPFDDYVNWYSFYWKAGTPPPEQNKLLADHRATLPGFFHSMGIPIVAGRDFSDSDDATRQRVLVVDELLAQRTWPGESALGKELNVEVCKEGGFVRGTGVVIGVVKHARNLQLTDDGRPQVYQSFAQSPREILAYTVRTTGDPQALVGAVRAEVARFDADLPLAKVRPMSEYVRLARAASRFTMLLAAALAALALILASIGIYGVTSYSVSQRRNEMGIRIALGAQRRDILKLVLSQGMGSVAAGVLIGLLLSLLLMPAIAGILFGVRPTDALTYAAVALFLSAVALLACYVPARRAMRVDPMTALRYE